jgi:acyl-coenzyme A synthetase/AMP-(fatty) acid ligase
MAKVDRLKEEVGWLKVVFGVLVAIDASVLGWLAQNYATARGILALATAGVIVVVTFAIVRVNRLAYRRINELEDA